MFNMDTEVGKTSMLKKFLRTGLEVKDDVIRELNRFLD